MVSEGGGGLGIKPPRSVQKKDVNNAATSKTWKTETERTTSKLLYLYVTPECAVKVWLLSCLRADDRSVSVHPPVLSSA